MIFWALLTLLCCAVTAALTVPLVRRFEADSPAEQAKEIDLYKQQLSEVEAEGDKGELSAEEVAAAKAEIGRRILSAERSGAGHETLAPLARRLAVASVMLAVIGGGIAIYRYDGRPDLVVDSARVPVTAPTAPAPAQLGGQASSQGSTAASQQVQAGNVDTMIAGLAQRLAKSPNDPEGWRTLGWSYFSTGRYPEAAEAYAKAAELSPTNADYKASQAEALIQAAGGQVTDQSRVLIDAALVLSPKDPKARFYKALGTEQAGKLDEALQQWTGLLADAPAGAGWANAVRTRIADISVRTGKSVDTALAVQAPSDLGTSGQTMGEAEKNAMIDGMVARLEDKLKSSPMDARGWEMLVRSYVVLGRTAEASDALSRAKAAFANAPVVLSQLDGLAGSLGIVVKQPAASAAPVPGVAAPDAQQAAAIQALPAQDRQAVIIGMVERLSDKLKQNPNDPDGWLKLIRSRLVLQQRDKAEGALKDALAALSGDAAGADRVRAGAIALGVQPSN